MRSATKYFSGGGIVEDYDGKIFCAGRKLNAAGGKVNATVAIMFCAGGIVICADAKVNGAAGIVNDNGARLNAFSVCVDSRRMREIIDS